MAMESTLFMEFQRQLDQLQVSKATEKSAKRPKEIINRIEKDLIKDNHKLVADTEQLRRDLKRAEERIRSLEKLFRDSHKKLTPKEVKILLNKST